MSTNPIVNNSFGSYTIPEGYNTFEEYSNYIKIQTIAYFILNISIVACSVIVFSLIALPLYVTLIPLSVAFFEFSRRAIKNMILFYALSKMPSTESLQIAGLDAISSTAVGEKSNSLYEGIAFNDPNKSNQMKLEFLRSAQHNFVLSANYLGGEFGNQALDILIEKMTENQNLRGTLILSEFFLTPGNHEKIEDLKRVSGDRLNLLICPETFFYGNAHTQETFLALNHVKALIIDYGKYFMVGGSGMQDRWMDDFDSNRDSDMLSSQIIQRMLPDQYLDMDYAFSSPIAHGIGRTIYKETLRLAHKWDILTSPEPSLSWDHITPPAEEMTTHIAAFDDHAEKTNALSLQLFVSGPEHQSNPFLQTLVEEIDNAKDSIEISNMYFHPTEPFLQALIRASNRGIQIKINTNGVSANTPAGHSFFYELSRSYYKRIFEGVPKDNVKVYEFLEPSRTIHDKYICIDQRKTFMGSSNISHRSLNMVDDELNMVIDSLILGSSLSQKYQERISQSTEVNPEEVHQYSILNQFFSWIQSHITFLF